MTSDSSERKSFFYGLSFSLVLHLFLIVALTASTWWPSTQHKPKVYSVTIEGGKKLGGITQAPKKTKKKQQLAPPKKLALLRKKLLNQSQNQRR